MEPITDSALARAYSDYRSQCIRDRIPFLNFEDWFWGPDDEEDWEDSEPLAYWDDDDEYPFDDDF